GVLVEFSNGFVAGDAKLLGVDNDQGLTIINQRDRILGGVHGYDIAGISGGQQCRGNGAGSIEKPNIHRRGGTWHPSNFGIAIILHNSLTIAARCANRNESTQRGRGGSNGG